MHTTIFRRLLNRLFRAVLSVLQRTSSGRWRR